MKLSKYRDQIEHFLTRPQTYAGIAFVILLTSTAYWSWLGAKVQQGNADQLVNGYLFESTHTFTGAFFPSTHTQLLKWPIFALLHLASFSPAVYIFGTVLLTLITIAAFSYLLYRIDKRPLHFGTTCLLLASVLALIPPQVSGTVTTPLNMAMLTGRNIEYILYIGALILCIKAKGIRNWKFLGASLILTLLIASDQIFLVPSLGSLAVIIAAWLLNNRQLQALAARWLAATGLAWLAAAVVQWLLNNFVTHLVASDSSYTTASLPNVTVSLPGTIKALALNFGINPENSAAILPTLLNLGTAAAIVWSTKWLITKLYAAKDRTQATFANAQIIAAMLLSSTAAVVVIYLFTAQSYVGDARYLTIALFAGFVMLATYLRTKQLTIQNAGTVGGIAALSTLLGLYSTTIHTNQLLATDPLRQRNQAIAQALQTHHVEFLVGNYWRVFPIKALSDHAGQKVAPLDSCTRPAQLLSSQAWRPDLHVHSFAYILTLHPVGTAAPACTKQFATFRFGHPTSQTIISGSHQNPAELLLFYDNGAAAQPLPNQQKRAPPD